ncbi:MAG: hypothetical protein KF724_07595 [Phycisphaeraceae bacterium]|nr:hypothetical protein [Phycisphaeraceae bacterium]
MASDILIDLSQIDLSARQIDSDRVGEILLQKGNMRHLDWVVWVDETVTKAVGVKQVRDDEFWVEGHIPGRPLMPGVIMIEAAAQLASVVRQLKMGEEGFLAFTRCDNCVFRGQVVPGDTLVLLAVEREGNRRRFVSQMQGLVNGKLVFEATITGMRI